MLAEIDRLREEVSLLRRKLVEERADRAVQREVQTVLSSLYSSPTVAPPNERPGRDLIDGRFVPAPVTVGGTRREAEPGAPRRRSDDLDLDVFGPDDESTTAFDEFMSAPDPHMERTRRFLLG